MIYVQDSDFTLHLGDVGEVLATLPDESVHCVVTSPPYFGLRDYGTRTWEGGDPDCEHKQTTARKDGGRVRVDGFNGSARPDSDKGAMNYRDVCGKCGARRIDQQLGLEPTPEAYVARMVAVFREVRRVLRSDGTCWLNIGDSYFGTGRGPSNDHKPAGLHSNVTETGGFPLKTLYTHETLKGKDLVGIPWRLAFALQADGWYLRSDVIWSKPNPMPESVTDRPTKAHEYLFLLTKSARYFYDADAIREGYKYDGRNVTTREAGEGSHENHRNGKRERWPGIGGSSHAARAALAAHDHDESEPMEINHAGRNKRSVWEIATESYPDAHFATFPQALVEPCVKAGTSERGCCPECGAPWVRRVVATAPDGRSAEVRGGKAYDEDGRPLMGDNMIDAGVRGSFNSGGATLNRETVGWRPTCDHGHEPIPCTVMDIFMGSGTTALVARRLGRRSIGIELSPEYAGLAAGRLSQLSLLAEEGAA